jgi:hypothetical protein
LEGIRWGQLNQVPEVAVEVLEDCHGAVGVGGGRADEAHAPRAEGAIVAPEVVRLEEQENAPARLVADEGLLLRRGGAGKEEGDAAGAGAGRGDEHPAFVLLGLIAVGDEGEAELVP